MGYKRLRCKRLAEPRHPVYVNVERPGARSEVGLFFLKKKKKKKLRQPHRLRETNDAGSWRFVDGTVVDDELRGVDVETIRVVCSDLSRSRWTAIASRDRLYQFMSMSDKETQGEIRRKLSTMTISEGTDSTSCATSSVDVFTIRNDPSSFRGIKR